MNSFEEINFPGFEKCIRVACATPCFNLIFILFCGPCLCCWNYFRNSRQQINALNAQLEHKGYQVSIRWEWDTIEKDGDILKVPSANNALVVKMNVPRRRQYCAENGLEFQLGERGIQNHQPISNLGLVNHDSSQVFTVTENPPPYESLRFESVELNPPILQSKSHE